MYPLFETICVDKGVLKNLEWHQMRYDKAYLEYYGVASKVKLANLIRKKFKLPENNDDAIVLPNLSGQAELHKLKLSYSKDDYQIELDPYQIKSIKTLKVVETDIDYHLKYSDRSELDLLGQLKSKYDDVLLAIDENIGDTSFCNIIFYDGERWFTPKTSILKGTAQARLLSNQEIFETEIKLSDIEKYLSFKLINAMRDFHSIEASEISNIHM